MDGEINKRNQKRGFGARPSTVIVKMYFFKRIRNRGLSDPNLLPGYGCPQLPKYVQLNPIHGNCFEWKKSLHRGDFTRDNDVLKWWAGWDSNPRPMP
jgi:hypothetical protein